MRGLLLFVALPLAAPAPAPAALAQAPGTDIYLVRLTRQDGTVRAGAPVNVTGRPGYDNQPAFAPDGRAIYYTSQREGQTDLFRLDWREGRWGPAVRLTETPESEYSPTVMPDGRGLSSVRVEGDSTQRLWRFGLDGKAEVPVFEAIKPVGYHAWAEEQIAYLFVLGQPATLQRADRRTGTAIVVAQNIGRTIAPVPGGGGMSFLQRDSTGGVVRVIDAGSDQPRAVARLPEGAAEFFAWLPTGELLAARGNQVLIRRPGDSSTWSTLASFAEPGLQRLSRLAVSPAGDWLAVVADEPRPQ